MAVASNKSAACPTTATSGWAARAWASASRTSRDDIPIMTGIRWATVT
jgi:hypothetical protein